MLLMHVYWMSIRSLQLENSINEVTAQLNLCETCGCPSLDMRSF